MMHMKSEHNACAKMEAEEIKASYERAAMCRELTLCMEVPVERRQKTAPLGAVFGVLSTAP